MPSSWNDRRVLVTGGSGLLGSHLIRRLHSEGAWVVCFNRDPDPQSPLWLSGESDQVAVAQGSLESFEHVRTAISEREVDTVIHLGAQAIVGVGRRNPIGTFESNIQGTWNVLEACRLYGQSVKRILVASSDKAYGDSDELPYVETMPLAARNPYDVSKSCADLIAQCYSQTYGLPVAIARCGNLYGPGDLNFSRLIPGTIRSLLNGERPKIRSNGRMIREYLYVEDAVQGYLDMAEWLDRPRREDDPQRAFNFTSGESLTVLEVVKRISMAMGCDGLLPEIMDSARGEIQVQRLSWTRARDTLGWAPKHALESALHETIRWYRTFFATRDRARSQCKTSLERGPMAPLRASA